VPFFIDLCKTLGKPVNFVPVIDKDVRRWWRSDSLWQAHDARYSADQVCIIPGTAAVAGITRVDEPVGELLDRFEQAAIDDVLATEGRDSQPPRDGLPARRHGASGPLAVVLDAPDVLWAAELPPTRCTASRRRRIGRSTPTPGRTPSAPPTRPPGRGSSWPASRWCSACRSPTSGSRSASPSRRRASTAVRPSCPPRTPPPRCVRCWRSPRQRRARAAAHPCRRCRVAVTAEWDPERVADHTGVTATFGDTLWPTLTVIPDAVVGLCWPAVFATIGSAVTETGFPVVEGLLSLVHLDHAAHLLAPLPKEPVELTVTATASAAHDTEVGRVVPVNVRSPPRRRAVGDPRGALRDSRPHR
jgi:fatty acid synthase